MDEPKEVVTSLKVVSLPANRDWDKSNNPRVIRVRNRVMQLYHAGLEPKEIAEQLNVEGVEKASGGDVTRSSVDSVVRTLIKRGALQARPLGANAIPLPEGPKNHGRLWCAVLHSNEIDDTTRTLMLRIMTERQK